jgi:hypothetical protein
MSSILKGLTLWNPYATAMIIAHSSGTPLKTVETRSWGTDYRGPIAIHSAKLDNFELQAAWIRAMNRPKDAEAFRGAGITSWESLSFGMLLGVGNLVACIPTSVIRRDTEARVIRLIGEEQWESEREWGNFAPGRFLWHVEEMDAFLTPVPYRGAQGLFNVEGITL